MQMAKVFPRNCRNKQKVRWKWSFSSLPFKNVMYWVSMRGTLYLEFHKKRFISQRQKGNFPERTVMLIQFHYFQVFDACWSVMLPQKQKGLFHRLLSFDISQIHNSFSEVSALTLLWYHTSELKTPLFPIPILLFRVDQLLQFMCTTSSQFTGICLASLYSVCKKTLAQPFLVLIIVFWSN